MSWDEWVAHITKTHAIIVPLTGPVELIEKKRK